MYFRQKALCIVALSLAMGAAHARHAANPRDLFPSEVAAYTGHAVTFAGGVSLDEAVAMVQAKYGARVMRANTVEEDGRIVHYIRLMTHDRSRVWTVRIDAATGREH